MDYPITGNRIDILDLTKWGLNTSMLVIFLALKL